MIDFPMAPTDWRGGRVGKIADHGHHAFFRSRSRQTPRQTPKPAGENSWENGHSWRSRFDWTAIVPKPATAATVWGKSQGKWPTMATTLFSHRDRAKTRDNPATGWGKIQRKPPMMAISLYFDRPPAKTRDNSPPLGKTPGKTANHSHFAEKRRSRVKELRGATMR